MFYQRGLSYWDVTAWILVGFLLLKIGLFAIPAYIDDRAINKTITDTYRSSEAVSNETFKSNLAAQLERNGIRDLKVDDIMTIEGESNQRKVTTNYERRANLMSNIDLIAHFSREFSPTQVEGSHIASPPPPLVTARASSAP